MKPLFSEVEKEACNLFGAAYAGMAEACRETTTPNFHADDHRVVGVDNLNDAYDVRDESDFLLDPTVRRPCALSGQTEIRRLCKLD